MIKYNYPNKQMFFHPIDPYPISHKSPQNSTPMVDGT